LEYDLLSYGANSMFLQTLNLVISVLTNIGSFYVVIAMTSWWWQLRASTTNLRPLILGIAVAKFSVWIWSGTQIVFTVFYDVMLPLWSLPARCLMLIGVLTHVWVTTRVKPIPREEPIAEPPHK
jgi:hypothetical protein